MTNRFDFQGKNKTENYFEGWYIKTSDEENNLSIALIPGVAHFSKNESFVQYNIIYKGQTFSGKIDFEREQFDVIGDPQTIVMPKFVFNEKGVKASLENGSDRILLDLTFGLFLPIEQSLYAPSIMGPLEYLDMPCSHDIISMKHSVKGKIVINGETVNITKGSGYIEKDRGRTFPDKYVWAHSNGFAENREASLFLSIAKVDFGPLSKNGAIAIFHDGEKEHRFASYSGSFLNVEVNEDQTAYKVILTDPFKRLEATVSLSNGRELIAPMNASMDYPIKETVKSTISLIFKEKRKNPVYLNSNNGAAELVNW
ncbi:MAG: hypothetical protein JJU16_05030 [Alkalibacterium sp.]|nr:hypothetical protein [Alkalibacterium sp.]